jgi:hypothetical protein
MPALGVGNDCTARVQHYDNWACQSRSGMSGTAHDSSKRRLPGPRPRWCRARRPAPGCSEFHPSSVPEKMGACPQVAFPFFPTLPINSKAQSVPDAQRAQRGHDGQHRDHASSVVRDSRATGGSPAAGSFSDVPAGRLRVQVSAERYVSMSVAGMPAETLPTSSV